MAPLGWDLTYMAGVRNAERGWVGVASAKNRHTQTVAVIVLVLPHTPILEVSVAVAGTHRTTQV